MRSLSGPKRSDVRPPGRPAFALPAAVLFCALVSPAAAAPSAPAAPASRVQTVLDLAYDLGEAHALRRACAGAGENGWRLAMEDVIAAEGPAGPAKARLTERFNAGYLAALAAHPACTPDTGAAERAVLRSAAGLADRLSSQQP